MTPEEQAAALGFTYPDWQPIEVATVRAKAESLGIRRVSQEETDRINRQMNARMPKTVMDVGFAGDGTPVLASTRPAEVPRPKWTPRRTSPMGDIARFARRPQGRAPRRATVRRPSRAGSRAAPSDSDSDPPPRRRLLRILDRIIAGWLGLAAFERRLAELDRETTRRLRGGA